MQPTPEDKSSEHIQELISDDENGCCLFLSGGGFKGWKSYTEKMKEFISGGGF